MAPRWSDDDLVAALRAADAIIGPAPLTTLAYERARTGGQVAPAATTMVNRFAGWAGALAAAGLTDRRVARPAVGHWDRARAAAALGAWCEHRGSRRYADYRAAAAGSGLPAPSTLQRLFGTWSAALVATGNSSGHHGFPTTRTVAQDPILAVQFDPAGNAGTDPAAVSARSSRLRWWRCPRCGHRWAASPMHRARNLACPGCGPPPRRPGGPSTADPVLRAEWHPVRNQDRQLADFGAGSAHRAWWRCRTCGHEWQARIGHRVRGSGCPLCRRSGPHQAPRLDDAVPELLDEWHPSRNGGLDPSALGVGSHRRAWWRCRRCGWEWEAVVANRARGTGCPRCARRWALTGQLLADLAPHLMAEWDYERNPGLDPAIMAGGAQTVVWWRCPVGHRWQASVCRRARLGHGCQACASSRTALAKHDQDAGHGGVATWRRHDQ